MDRRSYTKIAETLEHEHDRAETREFTTGAVNVDVGVDREPDLDRARGRAIDPGVGGHDLREADLHVHGASIRLTCAELVDEALHSPTRAR